MGVARRTPEDLFLREARKGLAYWKLQRGLAYGLSALFAAGSVFALWRAWAAGTASTTDLLGITSLLAASVASGMWQIHAQIMLGAARFVAAQADPTVARPTGQQS